MNAVPADASLRRGRASRSAIIGAGALCAAIILLMVALATSDQPTHAVVWGGLAFTACAVGYLCFVGAGYGSSLGLAEWKFGPWTLLWYGLTSGLASITFIQPQIGTASQIDLISVLRAMWLVAVGMTVCALGYLVGPGAAVRGFAVRRMEALGRRFTSDVRSRSAPWILYAIGSVARIGSTVTSGHFGYVGDASSAVTTASGYGQILSLLSLFAPLAVIAAALQVFRERLPGARVTLIALFLIEFAVSAVSGDKQSFIVLVLAVIIPYSAAHHRLPKLALILAVAVFMLIVIPFTGAYRNAARGGEATLTTSQAIDAAPDIFRQAVTVNNLVTALPASSGYLLQRIREIDSPAIILQRTPQQIGFLSPAQLVEAPLAALVPRAIWRGKPIMATGYTFNQDYYDSPSTSYTSAASTPAGSLYQYGGWIPMMAGMFILGCGMRLIDEAVDIRVSAHAALFILLFFPDWVKSEIGWIDLVASIPQTLALWLLACLLTFRARRPV
jgi:hypothetical protein